MRIIFTLPILVATAIGCSSTQLPAPEQNGKAMLTSSVETELGRQENFEMTIEAKIEAIDTASRRLTVRTQDNQSIQFVAGPTVRRFDELRVGDTVVADYSATLVFEVRPPTAQEVVSPMTKLSIAGRAPQSEAPGAAVVRGLHTIVTVSAIDRTAKTVTVTDPTGKPYTVQARNEERFARLNVGDTVAVTVTEGVGLRIEKK